MIFFKDFMKILGEETYGYVSYGKKRTVCAVTLPFSLIG